MIVNYSKFTTDGEMVMAGLVPGTMAYILQDVPNEQRTAQECFQVMSAELAVKVSELSGILQKISELRTHIQGKNQTDLDVRMQQICVQASNTYTAEALNIGDDPARGDEREELSRKSVVLWSARTRSP
jgi:hypothetical protein